MRTIFDLINAREIGVYYTETASNRIPYLGEVLFPAKKKLGLTLSWIKGSQGLPVALAPAEFDVKAPVRDRIGVSRIETEMPFFRESMRIGEKDRQQILMAMEAANKDIMNPIIQKIFDDAGNLIKGVDVDAERMRMQLLAGGKIKIAASGVAYDYDYKMKSSQKRSLSGTSKWSDTVNSNPVEDILTEMDTAEDETGNRPTSAICTRKTWGYLLQNEKIKKDMNVQNGQNIIMTDAVLEQYFLNKLKLKVVVYNKKFLLEVNGASQQFFPDNVFTLIPDGDLGNTYFGTTPEEADLLTNASQAKVSIVNTGTAVTTYAEPHPVNVLTIVSAICLPSFEAIDSVRILSVA
ncbi:phage major capsid protein e [Lucifera butyrica]|uniref:Phage major capsid protein e n=1 Tax=Lucifera butyrica TaxID=1351585 RepID=A0A498R279_9FIRM|nr:major capsid protein [Lucifera butyrica]VBB05574.1 phage major capsid protein e [Lucifera butyrica]